MREYMVFGKVSDDSDTEKWIGQAYDASQAAVIFVWLFGPQAGMEITVTGVHGFSIARTYRAP